MNANQDSSRSTVKKTGTKSAFITGKHKKPEKVLSCDEIDLAAVDGVKEEDDDYIYGRNKEGLLCRFSTEGVVEKELCTFGFQETEELNFDDMRRRIGDPEVCIWISYDKYMNLNQTV